MPPTPATPPPTSTGTAATRTLPRARTRSSRWRPRIPQPARAGSSTASAPSPGETPSSAVGIIRAARGGPIPDRRFRGNARGSSQPGRGGERGGRREHLSLPWASSHGTSRSIRGMSLTSMTISSLILGMENNEVPARKGTTRRVFLSASAAGAVAAPLVTLASPAGAATTRSAAAAGRKPSLPRAHFDRDLRALIRQIDPGRIQATIQRLSDFGTRHTASSQTDPVRGIGAATNWVFDQMQASAAASGGNMTVQKQTFVQPVSNRIPVPTTITNVIATLQGTASPQRYYVMTGHLDSRCTDVLDFTSDAPGADDDASGVAAVLELTRLFATRQFPGTLVFAAVGGEEQGLYGSTFMAQQMAAA